MRSLIYFPRFGAQRSEQAFVTALGESPRVEVVGLEHPSQIRGGDLLGFDAVVVAMKYRHLLEMNSPIEWGAFQGLRVMLDHDAIQNYWPMSRYCGTWPSTFARHRFDLAVLSGAVVCERLSSEGVPSKWLPKGYDSRHFTAADSRGAGSEALVTFGAPYGARRKMHVAASRAGFSIPWMRVPYEDLPAALSNVRAVVMCNWGTRPAHPHLPIFAARRWTSFQATESTSELMIKNFEAMAVGCCVIVERTLDAAELGLRSGIDHLEYTDFDEMVQIIRHLADDPSMAERIGRRAAAESLAHHTWNHRARRLVQMLDEAVR